MARRRTRDLTPEEYDNWNAATEQVQGRRRGGGRSGRAEPVAGARDRRGRGLADRPAAAGADPRPTGPPSPAMPFDGVELPDSRKRLAGWSAERQRLFLDQPGRDRLGPSRQRRRAPHRALGLSAAGPLARLRRGVGHGRPARRRAALRDRLRSRDQRPHRAGVAGRRAGGGEARAERPAADVAARPARSRAASPPRGSCARTPPPIPRRRRARASRRCSTRSRTPNRNSHHGQCEHWDHSRKAPALPAGRAHVPLARRPFV